jgi:Protein of unknown function (DUF1569)
MKTLRDPSVQLEIRSRLASVTREDSACWGKMSVHQMMCHLRDSCWVGLGEKKVVMVAIPVPRPVMKWLALQAPLHWPHGLKSPPEVAQDLDGTRPVEFESDRASLLSAVEQFCSRLREPCVPHPFFGSMTANDWWRWGYLHADHHLRQFGR